MTCVALAIGGILFVHARIMPIRDRCREDSDFLKSVRSFVPPETALVTTAGWAIARHIFYIDPPPQGIYDAANLEQHLHDSPFTLSRGEKKNRA